MVIAYADPGGGLEFLAGKAVGWGKPVLTLAVPETDNLVALGVRAMRITEMVELVARRSPSKRRTAPWKTESVPILTDLANVRENLLALSDDIWLNIDHNDSGAVRKGAEFKLAYNERMTEFERAAEQLSDLVEQFAGVDMAGDEEEADSESDATMRDRIMGGLDKQEGHGLSEDFRYSETLRSRVIPWLESIGGDAILAVGNAARLFSSTAGTLVSLPSAERPDPTPSLLPDASAFSHLQATGNTCDLRTTVSLASLLTASGSFNRALLEWLRRHPAIRTDAPLAWLVEGMLRRAACTLRESWGQPFTGPDTQ